MVYHNGKELLSEIRHLMDLNDISMKELSIRMGKSQQSLSRIFMTANPRYTTIIEICNALNFEIHISFIVKDDIE